MLKQGKQININVCTRCLDTPEKRRWERQHIIWLDSNRIDLKMQSLCNSIGQTSQCGQENWNKEWETLWIDISFVKGESYGSSKFWLLARDDKTDMSMSFFLAKKSETKTKWSLG
jgi:hypothetical protein